MNFANKPAVADSSGPSRAVNQSKQQRKQKHPKPMINGANQSQPCSSSGNSSSGSRKSTIFALFIGVLAISLSMISSAIGNDWFAQILSYFYYQHHNDDTPAATGILANEIILTAHSTVDDEGGDENKVVLAYLTPWNRGGYELTLKYPQKFTHLSPVWFRLKPLLHANGKRDFIVEGDHDIDHKWLSALAKLNNTNPPKSNIGPPLILPRYQLDGWTDRDFMDRLIQQPTARLNQFADSLIKHCSRHSFDGFVLETGVPLIYLKPALKHLGTRMHSLGKCNRLIVVLPPSTRYHGGGAQDLSVSAKDIEDLGDSVDGYSLMTYDYSTGRGEQGPNAPLPWFRYEIERLCPKKAAGICRKIFAGLNFYGYDFDTQKRQPEAITAEKYLHLLTKYQPELRFDSAAAEHFFEYNDDNRRKHLVYFPTKESIKQRVQLANEFGTGLSIWEIGQGLQHFLDCL